MKIGIEGIGLISPWGNDFNSFKQASKDRFQSLTEIERFEKKHISVDKAGFVHGFDPKIYLDAKRLRRYDIFSRLSIASAIQATRCRVDAWTKEELEDMGVVFACESQSSITALYLKDLFTDGPELVSPKLFPTVSANATGSNVSIELGIQGTNLNVSSKNASALLTIFNGVNLIRSQHAKHCLVGSSDHLSEIVMQAFSRFKAYKTEDNKNGFIPGEGSGTLILQEDEGTIGNILGMSFKCSKTKSYMWPTDSSMHAQVLEESLNSNMPDFIVSSYNGSEQLGDMEMEAFRKVFGNKTPEIFFIKDKIGDSGTSTIFQVALALTQDKSKKGLISVLSPGGIHGSLLVESKGWEAQMESLQQGMVANA